VELKRLLNTEYYYLTDHLGSIRVVLNEQGNVDSWTDYYPFGKEARSGSSNNEPKEGFTGKEYDNESGLNYFGARFYNSDVGRWFVNDPLANKFPNMSPYNYCNDNPISFIDDEGNWPKWVHHSLLDAAFKNTYCKDEIKTFKNASDWTDDSKENQTVEKSFMHAMRGKGQSPDDAINDLNTFTSKQMDKYQKLMNAGNNEEALSEMGKVFHAIMDLTCPPHEGFKEWDGNFFKYVTGNYLFDSHLMQEITDQNDTEDRMETTKFLLKQVNQWFKQNRKFTIKSIEVEDEDVDKTVKNYQQQGFIVIVDGVLRE
jgi:RHS repeat-associated protein